MRSSHLCIDGAIHRSSLGWAEVPLDGDSGAAKPPSVPGPACSPFQSRGRGGAGVSLGKDAVPLSTHHGRHPPSSGSPVLETSTWSNARPGMGRVGGEGTRGETESQPQSLPIFDPSPPPVTPSPTHSATLALPETSPSFLVFLLFIPRPQGEACNGAVALTVSDHPAAPIPPAHPGHLGGGSHLE